MRLELIARLYNRGYNSVEISKKLNDSGIRTPTGLCYTPKLVWVTQSKYQKRKERELKTLVSVDQDYFYIRRN
ncbi:hypothetical protein [Pseudidiomarina taiwanensis]|uniref:hypothetical protein n=1 Tax=Pseudidiomarina taiwanensis TaxID=337250 RepID=UPI000F89884F|nr:hypothetical protein [Pseudidiomarina taiwanensis]